MLCLGIESSCDESALALVQDGKLLDSVLASQSNLHSLFGGVVPELASREHCRFLGPLYDQLMTRNALRAEDLDAVAVARGPGLLGSLLVGTAFAKALALASGARFIGVNHLHAHLSAAGLFEPVPFPALGLLVSGGHTDIYLMEAPLRFTRLGRSLDDAAGEALDKIAKLLHLPYPGGAALDVLARRGTADPTLFPRPYLRNDDLDFSFSGLKTAVATYLADKSFPPVGNIDEKTSEELCRVCASVNLAVAETLLVKVQRALDRFPHISVLILAGGVAANTLLREEAARVMRERKGRLLAPPPFLCTDNAAMIAYFGTLLIQEGFTHDLNMETVPRGRAVPEDMLRRNVVYGAAPVNTLDTLHARH